MGMMRNRPGPLRPRYLPNRRSGDLLPLVYNLDGEQKIDAEENAHDLHGNAQRGCGENGGYDSCYNTADATCSDADAADVVLLESVVDGVADHDLPPVWSFTTLDS